MGLARHGCFRADSGTGQAGGVAAVTLSGMTGLLAGNGLSGKESPAQCGAPQSKITTYTVSQLPPDRHSLLSLRGLLAPSGCVCR